MHAMPGHVAAFESASVRHHALACAASLLLLHLDEVSAPRNIFLSALAELLKQTFLHNVAWMQNISTVSCMEAHMSSSKHVAEDKHMCQNTGNPGVQYQLV